MSVEQIIIGTILWMLVGSAWFIRILTEGSVSTLTDRAIYAPIIPILLVSAGMVGFTYLIKNFYDDAETELG